MGQSKPILWHFKQTWWMGHEYTNFYDLGFPYYVIVDSRDGALNKLVTCQDLTVSWKPT